MTDQDKIESIKKAIHEAALYVTCGLMPGGYDTATTFDAMGMDEEDRINLVYELEFLLSVDLGFEVGPTETPATLECRITGKFNK